MPSSNDYPRIAFQILPNGKISESGTNTIDFYASRGRKNRWYALGSGGSGLPVRRADVRVGYAYSHWKTTGTVRVIKGKLQKHRGTLKISGLAESHAPNRPETDVHFSIEREKTTEASAFRVVAYDNHGRILENHGSQSLGSSIDYYFGGSISTLAKIEVQTQPYSWVIFRGVTLRP
ncbi:MAG: hypothetical protein ACHQ50_09495 [Fimbriimonadales bacterium]